MKCYRFAGMMVLLLSSTAIAGREIKLSTTWDSSNPINVKEAWEGGELPGTDDIAVFDGIGGTYTTGGAVAWRGIKTKSLTGTLNLGLSKKELGEITLGDYGLQNETSANAFYLYTPIVIACDQAWTNSSGKALRFYSKISGAGKLTFYSKNDAATYAGANLMPDGGVVLSGSGKFYHNAGQYGTTLELAPGKDFEISRTSLEPYQFSDYFASQKVVNNGIFVTGRTADGLDMTMQSGDSIIGSGEVRVTMGTMRLSADGTVSNAVIKMQSGGKLELSGGRIWTDQLVFNSPANVSLLEGDIYIGKEGVTVEDSAVGSVLDISNATYHVAVSHDIPLSVTISGEAQLDVPGGVVFAPTTTFSGNGGLHKVGAGEINLAGATLSYAGMTSVDGGAIVFGAFTNDAPVSTASHEVSDVSVEMINDKVQVLKGNDTGSFTYAVAKKAWKNVGEAPVLGDSINGHKTLRFDGENSGLCLSSYSNSLSKGVSKFGVAIVFRATKGYGASDATDWRTLGGIVSANENTSRAAWGLRLDEAGHVVFGMAETAAYDAVNCFARDSSSVFDGQAHIAIGTWSVADGVLSVTVDGKRTEVPNTLTIDKTANNAVTTWLGVGEEKTAPSNGTAYRSTACEIAEVHYFKGVSLSAADVNEFGLSLALKYGTAWAPTSDPSAEFSGTGLSVASDAMAVLDPSGAVFGPGQMVSGAGQIIGGEVLLRSNAVLGPGSLSFDRLSLASGVRIAVPFVSGMAEAHIARNVTFPEGTVIFDVSGNKPTQDVVVFRWTGMAQGIENTTFTVSDASLKVKVDHAAKTISICPIRGLLMIVR